jgi:CRISPR system Cascade subunit CasC
MLVELHLLQNFAPSNLNRDDTGAPKDCELGGHRRARISSQSIKRAIRQTFKIEELLGTEHLAARTKRAAQAIAERLKARDGDRTMEDATAVAGALLNSIKGGLHNTADGKTQYLLFLGGSELDGAASVATTYWDALLAAGRAAATPASEDGGEQQPAAPSRAGRAGRAPRQANAASTLPPAVRTDLINQLDGGRSADLALFGRMIADLPDQNVDAASQVAHAVSTNRVSMEMDFYTAVDDLKPDDTAGADMLGTIEFNSACFYRYSNVDLAQLRHNLGDDEDLARQTLRAFLWSSILAIPTGKQNSMAAHNPPSLVLAVARESGPWNLANAFVKPVWPGRDGDLVKQSVGALDDYWGKLTAMYGARGILGQWLCTTEQESLATLRAAFVENVDALVGQVLGAASFADRERAGRS